MLDRRITVFNTARPEIIAKTSSNAEKQAIAKIKNVIRMGKDGQDTQVQ